MREFKNLDSADYYCVYHNPYYDPEKCGLELLEVHEEPNLSYEFNMVVLWRDKETGRYYWKQDSGCSCPSPFEDVKGLGDLVEGMSGYADAVRDVEHPPQYDYKSRSYIRWGDEGYDAESEY